MEKLSREQYVVRHIDTTPNHSCRFRVKRFLFLILCYILHTEKTPYVLEL